MDKPKKKRKFYPVAVITSALRKVWLWSPLRREALKIANNCCEECGAAKKDGAKLEVHHTIPCDLTKEAKRIAEKLFPPVETLDVLCHNCHQERHKHD